MQLLFSNTLYFIYTNAVECKVYWYIGIISMYLEWHHIQIYVGLNIPIDTEQNAV